MPSGKSCKWLKCKQTGFFKLWNDTFSKKNFKPSCQKTLFTEVYWIDDEVVKKIEGLLSYRLGKALHTTEFEKQWLESVQNSY